MPNSFQLSVDCDLPSGNIRAMDVCLAANPPEVHVAAVPKGGPESVWFHFRLRVEGGKAPPVVRVVLRYFETLMGNGVGAGEKGFHPVYRTQRRDWTRVESVIRLVETDGQIRVAWDVPGDEGDVRIALCYPYAMAELEDFLSDTGDVWSRNAIGLTGEGRELIRLLNHAGAEGGEEPGVYVVARQHAAESPGSWVLDGFLRRMTEMGDAAPLVWAVPFADVDGVLEGRPGKDAYPWDFNRAWGSKAFPRELWKDYGTHPMRPEVGALQRDLQRWTKRCAPRLVLDFHAPTVCDTNGAFLFLRDLGEDGEADAAHVPWVRAIEEKIEPSCKGDPFVRSGRYLSRWNTARFGDYVNQVLGVPFLTVETPYGCSPHKLLLREDYQTLGGCIADAFSFGVSSQK